MFTGIITDIGEILRVEGAATKCVTIGVAYDTAGIAIGASIACNGICLTVISVSSPLEGGWFCVELAPETLSRTTAKHWKEGARLNLERALKVGDELGGHFVTGHVDGIAKVTECIEDGGSKRLTLTCDKALLPYIAEKGSVTLDGVALTVTHTDNESFGVMLIPHTMQVTTLADVQTGMELNLEVDLIARYLHRLSSRTNEQ